MLASRHQAVVKEIDTARCVGRWNAIADLATKYAKHGPNGQVYSAIITSEASIESHLQSVTWNPRTHWSKDGDLKTSNAESIQLHIEYPIKLNDSKTLRSIEEDLVAHTKQSMTKEEEYQYKVILAKVYFYGGEFDKCQQMLEPLPTTIEESTLSPSYCKQLYIAQMVMRGITCEMQGKLREAQKIYTQTISEFKTKIGPQAIFIVPCSPRSPLSSASSESEEIVNWAEEALYRRATVTVSLGDKDHGVQWLAEYISQTEAVSPHSFRAFRRTRANRLLMQLLREDISSARPTTAASVKNKELAQEIIACHQHQMVLLKNALSFPNANESNVEVLDEVNSAVDDWNMVRAYSKTDTLKLLEILYQAVHITYNMPSIMRHLVHTLIRFGNYHEAGLAFETYMSLIERQLESVQKLVNTALADGVTLSSLVGPETESIQDILETIATGARLKLFHISDAHECLSLIHFSNSLIDKLEDKDPEYIAMPQVSQSVCSQLALWKGAAHGKLSQLSLDPKNRLNHHNLSLQSLEQAVALDPQSYDAHFQLALQQAVGARDILASTSSAKQAVALNPKRTDAWHLLVLLATAKKDYKSALQICEVALKQCSEWYQVDRSIQEGSSPNNNNTVTQLGLVVPKTNTGSSRGTTNPNSNSNIITGYKHADIESGISYFDLKITQALIEGQIKGAMGYLAMQPHLFALFGYIYGPIVNSSETLDNSFSTMELIQSPLACNNGLNASMGGGGSGVERAYSQTSGKRSVARSLARSMFTRHSRRRSLNATDEYDSGSLGRQNGGGRWRDTSLSHLRHLSHDTRKHPVPPLTSLNSSAEGTSNEKIPNVQTKSSDPALLKADVTTKEEEDQKHKAPESSESSATSSPQNSKPSRQRSMPHLRKISQSSSMASPDLPTEAYFDSIEEGAIHQRTHSGENGSIIPISQRSVSVSKVQSLSGVYYTSKPSRIREQRARASHTLSELWLNSAVALTKLDRIDEAAAAVSEAIGAWPESPSAITMRGQLEISRGDYVTALNEFHAAVALESDHIRATVCLAQVENLLGRRDVAIGLLKNIIRAKGWSDPEAWYWLGRLEREVALENVECKSCEYSEEESPMNVDAGEVEFGGPRVRLSDHPTINRAAEYVSYALDLETSQPVREFAFLQI